MRKLMLLFFLFIFLAGCMAPEKQPATAEPAAVTESAEAAVENISLENRTIAVPSGEVISQLRCVDRRIEAVITNIIDRPMNVNNDIKVILGGKFVVHPSNIKCEKAVLQPGESMFCSDLVGGQYPVGEKNRIIFRIAGIEEGILEIVECPK
jgi:hypothetical protein